MFPNQFPHPPTSCDIEQIIVTAIQFSKVYLRPTAARQRLLPATGCTRPCGHPSSVGRQRAHGNREVDETHRSYNRPAQPAVDAIRTHRLAKILSNRRVPYSRCATAEPYPREFAFDGMMGGSLHGSYLLCVVLGMCVEWIR